MERITLNMVPTGVLEVCHASQYDIGREIRFDLINGTDDFVLSGDEDITIFIRDFKGNLIVSSAPNTSSDYVVWTSSEGELDVSGPAICELRVTKDDDVLGSANFIMEIEADAYDGTGVHVETVGPADICKFETDLAEPLQSVTADIVATQSGSGTPYPAGGGKNKFDGEYPSLDTTLHYRGIYVGNGTFTMSSNCPVVEGAALVFFLEGNVSTGASTSINGVSNNISRTVTTTDGYVTIAYRTYGTPTISPANYNVQIEAGSEATPFAPYSNVRPINGYSSTNITRCGVNLFDKDGGNVINAYLSTKIEALAVCRTVFAKCNPSTQYTISKTAGQRFIVAYTKETPDINVNIYGSVQDATASHISITTGPDAKYIVAMVYNGNVDTGTAYEMLASVQIAEGTDTTYHAYNGQTYAVAFGQTVYGGVLDVTNGTLTLNRWFMQKTWGEGAGTPALTNYTRRTFALPTADYNVYPPSVGMPQMCNVAEYLANYSSETLHFYCNTRETILFLPNGTPDDTVVQFSGELATPFDIDLTPEVISAIVGEENNVFADCGQSTVKFLKAGG